ncbi:MAG TPA: S9 family peptidase [Sphingomicrobium sp.]
MRKYLVCCVAAWAAAASAAPGPSTRPPVIPVADFAALPLLRKPLLSPDGHRIAARKVADGKTTIVILDADHPEATPRLIELGKAHVAGLTWAGNQRLLLTVMSERHIYHVDVDIPYLRLIAIDVDTGSSRLVDQKSHGTYAGDVLYTDPTGNWALVASQTDSWVYPSVKRVDLATGDSTVVEKPRDGVWDWYADEHGVVRAGVSYSNRRWTVWYRDKPEDKLQAIRGKFEKADDSAVDRFIFRGSNSWIVTNQRTGRFGLYKYDTKTGAIGEPIFEHPEFDIDFPVYNDATGSIRAVVYEDDRYRVHWFDPDLQALQAKVDKALPNTVNLPVDSSADDKRTLIFASGASDPGRYFLLDRTTRQMHAVVAPYPRIDPDLLSEVRPIRYQTRDGLALRGYLTLPRGREAKGLPLILMPHGGPFVRDDWEYDAWVQFLANRGYAVLQPEFRGSTGYGKQLVEKGYGEWGRKMQDDLDDAVDWLARSGQIDSKRVCIVGGSYGGYAALWGAIRNPERYRCAASMAGVSDLPALLRYDRQFFSARRYFREWRAKIAGADDTNLGSVSPINFVDRVKVPLFIAHGEDDETVPPAQSHAMVDALTKAGANVTSAFYKDSGHGFDSSADLEDWLRRLDAFLAKNNPA